MQPYQSTRESPHVRRVLIDQRRPASRPQPPSENLLLAALPTKDYQQLLPQLEPLSLPLDWTLNRAGDPRSHLYFPTSGIVARFHLMKNGKSAAFAITGNEGVLGIGAFLSGVDMPNETVVLNAGSGYRLRWDRARSAFEQNGALSQLLLGHTVALIAEVGQNAACNRHHSVEQQLCRYILSFSDRLQSHELTMTQCSIADLVGVRREGVTQAIGKLQKAGLVACRRGHIAILDRAGLEAESCECYAIIKSAYARSLRSQDANPVAQRRAIVSHTAQR